MVDLSNPAARLDRFLHLIDNQPKEVNGIVAVCSVWDLDLNVAADQQVVMRRLTEVMALGPDVRLRAEAIPKYGPMVLKNYERIETTLFNLMMIRSHSLAQILEPMDGRGWTCMEQLIDLLDGEEPPFELQEKQADRALNDVMALIRKVHDDASLTDRQRQVILEHLIAVQRALLDIDIVGPEGVSQAANGLMGALLVVGYKVEGWMKNPVVASSLALIAILSETLGIAADWQTVIDAGGGPFMLGPGGGGGST